MGPGTTKVFHDEGAASLPEWADVGDPALAFSLGVSTRYLDE